MTYRRVIPRDLFNEANLLKCLGQLYLCSERLPEGKLTVSLNWCSTSFRIEQDQNDGSISCATISVTMNGKVADCSRPLNSREPWPLYAQTDGGEPVAVFDNLGHLTEEFENL